MSLALYRQYRPGTLAEVVGQDHVVEPLRRALTSGRVHHAFLFSGPRGCGKTSTARILARSLNCVQGPTPDPCGVCDSCVQLAPNGPGSDDVIELDAASHGGVDDTRDLRSKVIYTPASSRYRVYIIDEAHMVTKQGFNALLKVIEEPPEFARFVFATTEPEKVLPTIRSRTYNYAFRLVPTSTLVGHLGSVCRSEGVDYTDSALSMVAKASGGSVRDSLSILGQLISGSDDSGLGDDYVASALGVTDAVLLDRVLAAVAARDGAGVFAAIDTVLSSGHDPRRFLTDLLQRLRDLLVLVHVPHADHPALLEIPQDQVDSLRTQAQAFGPAQLTRAAEVVSEGLTHVKGATAPQLQLELLMAKLLLPETEQGIEGLAMRLERLERHVASGVAVTREVGGPDPAAGRRPAVPRPTSSPAPEEATPTADSAGVGPDALEEPTDRQPADPPPAPSRRPPAGGPSGPPPGPPSPPAAARPVTPPAPPRLSSVAPAAPSPTPAPEVSSTAASPQLPDRAPEPATAASSGSAAEPSVDLTRIVRAWGDVLEQVGKRGRVAWTLWAGSRPVALHDGALTVEVAESGRLRRLTSSRHDELLRQVLIDVLSVDVRVTPVAPGDTSTPASADPTPPRAAPPGVGADRAGPTPPAPPTTETASPSPEAGSEEQDREGASLDDPDLDDGGLSGEELLMRELGAVRINEPGGL